MPGKSYKLWKQGLKELAKFLYYDEPKENWNHSAPPLSINKLDAISSEPGVHHSNSITLPKLLFNPPYQFRNEFSGCGCWSFYSRFFSLFFLTPKWDFFLFLFLLKIESLTLKKEHVNKNSKMFFWLKLDYKLNY